MEVVFRVLSRLSRLILPVFGGGYAAVLPLAGTAVRRGIGVPRASDATCGTYGINRRTSSNQRKASVR